MVKTKIALIIFLVIACVAALLPWAVQPKQPIKTEGTFEEIVVGNQKMRVEVVRTPQQIMQGLSDRAELGSDGMLFVMPSRSIPRFWMKHMQFALDFVWIDQNKIIDLTENVPAPSPNTQDAELQTYAPRSAVTHVLELPAGAVQKRGLAVGDSFSTGVR